MGSMQNRGMNVTEMHDVFCVLCSSARSLFIWAKIIRYVFDVGSPPPLGIEEGIAAAQTALRPSNCRSLSPRFSALSLNEQVHRELRRVEAAATTDNEPGTDGRTDEEEEEEDIQRSERRAAPPAAVRTLCTSASSSIRACVRHSIAGRQRERET